MDSYDNDWLFMLDDDLFCIWLDELKEKTGDDTEKREPKDVDTI